MENENQEAVSVLETMTETSIRAKCPFCGFVRHICKPTQVVARCLNPECKTRSGNQTVFWILRRTVGDGVVCERRINTEN